MFLDPLSITNPNINRVDYEEQGQIGLVQILHPSRLYTHPPDLRDNPNICFDTSYGRENSMVAFDDPFLHQACI
jgi:hypothetical protein